MKNTLRQITVIVTTLVMLAVNYLSTALPLNGRTPGEISDSFKVYFVPAGYVFSIWGVIYLGMIAFSIYQALPSQRQNPRLQATGWWIALGNLANAAWIFMWHYGYYLLSVVVMLILLGSLIVTYLKLRQERLSVTPAEQWAVRLPFSIYLGWITVATVANVTTLLDYLKWNRFGIAPEIWMGVMLVAVLVITGLMIFTRRDIAYTLVILWALAGIGVKQGAVPVVAIPAWITLGLVALALVIALAWRPRAQAIL